MNFHVLVNLFLSGIILGSSVCTVFCGWIFLPFVFEKNQNIRRAIARFILFHSGKIASYTIIGGLAGYSTSFISSFKYSKIPIFLGSTFFFILAVVNLLVHEETRVKMKKNFACLSGFLVAFIPCGALIGVIVYLAYVANSFFAGAFGGFIFGLGNAINPLIFLVFCSTRCSEWGGNFIKNTAIFKIGVSLVFMSWSVTLLLKAFQ